MRVESHRQAEYSLISGIMLTTKEDGQRRRVTHTTTSRSPDNPRDLPLLHEVDHQTMHTAPSDFKQFETCSVKPGQFKPDFAGSESTGVQKRLMIRLCLARLRLHPVDRKGVRRGRGQTLSVDPQPGSGCVGLRRQLPDAAVWFGVAPATRSFGMRNNVRRAALGRCREGTRALSGSR